MVVGNTLVAAGTRRTALEVARHKALEVAPHKTLVGRERDFRIALVVVIHSSFRLRGDLRGLHRSELVEAVEDSQAVDHQELSMTLVSRREGTSVR